MLILHWILCRAVTGGSPAAYSPVLPTVIQVTRPYQCSSFTQTQPLPLTLCCKILLSFYEELKLMVYKGHLYAQKAFILPECIDI